MHYATRCTIEDRNSISRYIKPRPIDLRYRAGATAKFIQPSGIYLYIYMYTVARRGQSVGNFNYAPYICMHLAPSSLLFFSSSSFTKKEASKEEDGIDRAAARTGIYIGGNLHREK